MKKIAINSTDSVDTIAERACASAMLELHSLIRQGASNSLEAENVRDRLDELSSKLTTEQQERIAWLSEDLYSFKDPKLPVKGMNPQIAGKLQFAQKLMNERRIDSYLAVLRRCKNYIYHEFLSYLRGQAYSALEYSDVAAEFYLNAHKIDTGNPSYHFFYLYEMSRFNREKAFALSDEVISNWTQYPATSAVQAIAIKYSLYISEGSDEKKAAVLSLLTILEQIELNWSFDEEYDFVFAVVKIVQSYMLHQLNRETEAIDALSKALLHDPENTDINICRGILLYENKREIAVQDFERARWRNTGDVWPYFYLAHYYLKSARFDDAREMCLIGQKMEASIEIESLFFEWQAICEAELGFNHQRVEELFRKALQLNPNSELGQRNFAIFLQRQSTRQNDVNWSSIPNLSKFEEVSFAGGYRRTIQAPLVA